MERGLEGPVVMLNLLRFREVADYSGAPQLAPDAPISGEEAYALYMDAVAPLLEASGGGVERAAHGGHFLIGPADEQWDLILVVRHASAAKFLGFATDESYLAVAGHRTAALADSRLLPMMDIPRLR